jgi:hypothetical protein
VEDTQRDRRPLSESGEFHHVPRRCVDEGFVRRDFALAQRRAGQHQSACLRSGRRRPSRSVCRRATRLTIVGGLHVRMSLAEAARTRRVPGPEPLVELEAVARRIVGPSVGNCDAHGYVVHCACHLASRHTSWDPRRTQSRDEIASCSTLDRDSARREPTRPARRAVHRRSGRTS